MDPDSSSLLRGLLSQRPVATLATLHRGEPATSMVPFVLPAGEAGFIIHVSALATHTRDLQDHPRASLLVMAGEDRRWTPQATPRVSLQVQAQVLPREGERYERARAHYLARFPDAAQTFELADFSIVLLRPLSARLVAGFGRAYALTGDALEAWLRAPA